MLQLLLTDSNLGLTGAPNCVECVETSCHKNYVACYAGGCFRSIRWKHSKSCHFRPLCSTSCMLTQVVRWSSIIKVCSHPLHKHGALASFYRQFRKWLIVLEYCVIPCRLWFKGLGNGEEWLTTTPMTSAQVYWAVIVIGEAHNGGGVYGWNDWYVTSFKI